MKEIQPPNSDTLETQNRYKLAKQQIIEILEAQANHHQESPNTETLFIEEEILFKILSKKLFNMGNVIGKKEFPIILTELVNEGILRENKDYFDKDSKHNTATSIEKLGIEKSVIPH